MDEVRIEGIEFHGHHGVSVAEQQVGHRFRVDLTLELDLRPAAHSEDLSLTVDYSAAVREVLEIGTGTSMQLVESLAERISARLLGRFPQLEGVQVHVTKLQPPAPLPFQTATVRIRRTRL